MITSNSIDRKIPRELREAWPGLDWPGADVVHGAFHRVIRFATSSVIRLASGTAHASRAESEFHNLETLSSLGLPLRIPIPLSGVHVFGLGSAYRTSFVHGEPLDDPEWEAVREPIATVLAALHSAALPDGARLRPLRDWCGGAAWPALVDRIARQLDDGLRRRATAVVEQVLEVEQSIPHVVVHGDLGPHNLLFSDDDAFGLIDFDNACLGDPAIDIAPLIGIFGSAAVADVADAETIRRGKVHRASLSLQVAAAAHLVGDEGLRDHALHNFAVRVGAGTLYEPFPRAD